MAKIVPKKNKQQMGSDMFLEDIEEGSTGPVVVMICRKWDVNNVNGRYMSTDFIVTDKKGGVMHCVARNNIAHVFVDKLQEGVVYSIKGFNVQARDTYRLIKDSHYTIQLQGNTIVKTLTEDLGSFIRHPFSLAAFEDLEATGNKYFVDVVGYVTSVGEPSVKGNGARTVEFDLSNERNRHVRVTLWGEIGEAMIKKKRANPGVYCLILTSMTVKPYAGILCLSSSSSTMLIDSKEVPAVDAFKKSISFVKVGEYNEPITENIPVVETLSELVERSRDQKNEGPVVFRNTVEITGVRTKNSWFVFTCSGGECRKGVTRESGVYKCKGCNTKVDYPRTRFRLQLDVHDGTMTTVVVCFDETAEKLVNRTAKSLLDEQQRDESAEASILPPVVEALIGTKHFFEIKSHTYYHYGEYESFNCEKVILPDDEPESDKNLNVDDHVSSGTGDRAPFQTSGEIKHHSSSDDQTASKRKKFCVEESDSDETSVGDKGCSDGTSKQRKRLCKVSDGDANKEDYVDEMHEELGTS